MNKETSKANSNPLKSHIDNNYPVNEVQSIEIFSFEELSAAEVEAIFVNTYEPLNGTVVNKSIKLSAFEQCELSSIKLIKPLFLAAQLSRAYFDGVNSIMGGSHKPIADAALFNEFFKNSKERKLEEALCLEEAHAYLHAELSKHKHIHCYTDALSDNKKDTLSILDSKVVYKKLDIRSHSLYKALGDLVGFDSIKVPKVAIFVDMVDSDKSAFILKIHDMIYFLEMGGNEERFAELKLALVQTRNESEVTEYKPGDDFILTESGIISYRNVLKSPLVLDSINRIKKFNML